jgi:hypothetical protein
LQRSIIAAAAAAALCSACKVERTPPEYFDHPSWSEEEVSETAAELQDRLLALAQALGRRSVTEAMIALAPDPEAVVLTPQPGLVLSGAEEIQVGLREIIDSRRSLRLSKVTVTVSPEGSTAWFQAEGEARDDAAEEPTPLLVTGVYVRSGGAWQLMSAHISTPGPPPSPQEV